MNITITEIEDINVDNIDETKVNFADTIINKIKPIMDNLLLKTNSDIDKYKKKNIFKDNEIKTKKEKLRKDSYQLKKQEKVSILLDNISKLVDLDVTKNVSFRKEIIILLKILPKLSEEKLGKHIEKTNKILKNRME